jgi:hypothetical protein
MKYKRGQQLVCVYKGTWKDIQTQQVEPGPKFNEIVTCDGYNPFAREFLFLKEYQEGNYDGRPQAFYEECFAPLISDKVLENELNKIFHKATA